MASLYPLEAINLVLRHARNSPFYRNHLPSTRLQSWKDFKRLPFLRKEDLRQQSPEGLVCVPRQKVLQYHETSATTGDPVSVWYSGESMARIHTQLAEWGVGFHEEDRVLIRFPYALSSIAHFVQAAVHRKQACVIAADTGTPITPLPRVVQLMRKLQVSVLATLSLQAVVIAEAAEMAGLDTRRDFPHLRAICCGGEPLTPYRRQLLHEIWGVPVYDNYGMTETGPQAMDCAQHGLHPWGDFWMEVLDDRLEQEVAQGETGNLVVTSLTPEATPMIRYVTGDRVRLLTRPCACGQNTTLQVRGRADDILWVQDKPFDLWELQAIVSKLPSRRFWKAAAEPRRLRFIVEKERDGDQIQPGLLEQLRQDHGVQVWVDLVPKGTLYDRNEPVAFGRPGKPSYTCTPAELAALVDASRPPRLEQMEAAR
ncbi:Phenylacetate-coenzyme A ligase [Cystobacter fuscus DSM 2262]|uniref:Phenylacetate-coenzyme A ligase n=1 Tax=Cystobacter fuscus (strain ATCC 25194 / DSM 2262 / NBRC 100088 / M29) TaxID=1242864 RepID=S9QXT9_CYSF2|nr:AMP-binding protein [Cystobacter fuscus]EPX61483.1 Phenylacetate-coenzyme A ligase [Cystobacter fuscus DSM 2262]